MAAPKLEPVSRKLFLLIASISLVFAVALLSSCGTQSSSDSQLQDVEKFFDEMQPFVDYHVMTTAQVNEANVSLANTLTPNSTIQEQATATKTYLAKLQWAMPRIRETLQSMQAVVPPPAAGDIHLTLLAAVQEDLGGITGLVGFYNSVLKFGISDITALNVANEHLGRGRILAMRATQDMKALSLRLEER